MTRRQPDAGMTLVEVLVALAVFAVIGTASFALLDQTLRSQRLTETRLARLADLQRMMRVITLDTMQALPGSVTVEGGDLALLRRGALRTPSGPGAEGLSVHYHLDASGLQRQIGLEGSKPEWQVLLADVKAVTWQPILQQLPAEAPANPLPVVGLALTVHLASAETIRGVFVLPSNPPLEAGP